MKRILLSAALLLSAAPTIFAQEAPTTQAPITREEYEKMRQEQDAMRREIQQLKADRKSVV